MATIAQHPGKVTAVAEGVVTVTIVSTSACSQCEAHAHCGFAENKEKSIDIATRQWQQYSVGDSVQVNIDTSLGLKAVLLAYLLPAILLLAVLFPLLNVISEPLAVLIALAALTLYYSILYKCRNRLQKKFTFGIVRCE